MLSVPSPLNDSTNRGGFEEALAQTTERSVTAAPAAPCFLSLLADASLLEEAFHPNKKLKPSPLDTEGVGVIGIEGTIPPSLGTSVRPRCPSRPIPRTTSAEAANDSGHTSGSSRATSPAVPGRSYLCKQCGREYASTDAVRKHARQNHTEWLREMGQGSPLLYCTPVDNAAPASVGATTIAGAGSGSSNPPMSLATVRPETKARAVVAELSTPPPLATFTPGDLVMPAPNQVGREESEQAAAPLPLGAHGLPVGAFAHATVASMGETAVPGQGMPPSTNPRGPIAAGTARLLSGSGPLWTSITWMSKGASTNRKKRKVDHPPMGATPVQPMATAMPLPLGQGGDDSGALGGAPQGEQGSSHGAWGSNSPTKRSQPSGGLIWMDGLHNQNRRQCPIHRHMMPGPTAAVAAVGGSPISVDGVHAHHEEGARGPPKRQITPPTSVSDDRVREAMARVNAMVKSDDQGLVDVVYAYFEEHGEAVKCSDAMRTAIGRAAPDDGKRDRQLECAITRARKRWELSHPDINVLALGKQSTRNASQGKQNASQSVGMSVGSLVSSGAVPACSAAASQDPPKCWCGYTAAWVLGRWCCLARAAASGVGFGDHLEGCHFEQRVPPVPWTPLCDCRRRACWEPLSERFLCHLPRSRGGCGFEAPIQPETPDRAVLVPPAEVEKQAAMSTAELLTAAAFGVGDHCFVAPCDVGLGLFARASLQRGQAIVQYDGPRLKMRHLVHSSYALEVPDGSDTFIDGNLENCSAADRASHPERSPAIYANHSRRPNCRLEHWPRHSADTRDTLWLVASENIEAGIELRFDYEEGGSSYWQGFPPLEADWRSKRVAPPPPSGVEASIDYLPALLKGHHPRWPDGSCMGSWDHGGTSTCTQARRRR